MVKEGQDEQGTQQGDRTPVQSGGGGDEEQPGRLLREADAQRLQGGEGLEEDVAWQVGSCGGRRNRGRSWKN